MAANPEIINTAAQVQELAKALHGAPIISFDTEFIRETTFYPVVEIIQVATETDSWLVDAQAFKKKDPAGIKPLLDIFEDKSVLKIIHAAQGDQECIFTGFGVVASPSLDTAVAASLCGYGDGIGLGNLLKAVLNVTIKKGHARTNWSVRPLPPQLLEYAHADVEHLVRLGKTLMDQLDKLGRREWALELSSKWEDKALYLPDPEGITHKLAKGGRLDKKGYAALFELVRWREDRVRSLNLPRRWVADDHVLVDVANVRPKDIDHLATFRGLNKGELKNSGEAILQALRKAEQEPEKFTPAPRGPRLELPNAAESRVLDLLQCYVGILSDRHQIAAKHLLTSAQLLPLLRSGAKLPQDLVDKGILSEGAARLVGAEILAMLSGQRALSVQGGRNVQIVDLSSESN